MYAIVCALFSVTSGMDSIGLHVKSFKIQNPLLFAPILLMCIATSWKFSLELIFETFEDPMHMKGVALQ